MEKNKLNFSGLFSGKPPETQKNATETPSERFLDKGNDFTLPKEKAENERVEGTKKLLIQYEQAKTDRKNRADAYLQYHQNALKSAELQTAIIKGLNEGQDLTTLFLQAVQAISVMTDCADFYRIVAETVKTVYGLGLRKENALAAELADVEERLDNLQEAYLWAEGDEQKRIGRAIEAHRSRIKKITELMNSGKV